MRNFIWVLRRSVPRCKSSMEHSHGQFKQQRISFGLSPNVQSVCGVWRLLRGLLRQAVEVNCWLIMASRYLLLWAPALKWPRWTEKCGGELGSHQQRHYHLFANDKEALTASAPAAAAPPLWFSAHFSPADKTFLRSIFHSLSSYQNTWPAKSLHTSNVESGKKFALMNFVGSVGSSEQLKGERLWLEFTVNNLLLASSSCQPLGFSAAGSKQQRAANSLLTPDNWKVPRLDQSDSAATFDFRAELQLFSGFV